jgi:hypothetical protein
MAYLDGTQLRQFMRILGRTPSQNAQKVGGGG